MKFNTDYPIDRLIFRPDMPGGSGSISVAPMTFSSFSFDNQLGESFVPIVRYSYDAGATWLYNGDANQEYSALHMSLMNHIQMEVFCTDTTVTVYYANGPWTDNTIYEIYGLAKRV